MSDDLEEINLAPTRSGSAKKIRAGRKRAMAVVNRTNGTPKWLRELNQKRGGKKRPVTLAPIAGQSEGQT